MSKGKINDALPMNIDTCNFVVLANDFIEGKCSLSKNSKKLFRMAVMQIKPNEETDTMSYKLSIEDFGKIIGTSGDSLYRHLDRITDELISESITLKDRDNPKNKWIKMNYCSRCSYDNGQIYIVLNNELKPYLVGLSKYYTQYQFYTISKFSSGYGIDLFELIKKELLNDYVIKPHQVKTVFISNEVLRQRTDTEDKYPRPFHFEQRVLKPGIEDINNIDQGIRIKEYRAIKKGRSVTGYEFDITSYAAQHPLRPELQAKVDANLKKFKERDIKRHKKIKKEYEAAGIDEDEYIRKRGDTDNPL